MSPVRPTFTVVGRRLEPEHHRLRDFLTRGAQPFDWVEADAPEGRRLLEEHGAAAAELPVVIDDDAVIAGASVERLDEEWGLTDPPSRPDYDLAIVGAGPAGLAAAVYAASDGLSTVVVERDLPGGQASHTSMIENFFGFPEGIGGAELSRLAGRQAERFGAELVLLRGVTGSRLDADDEDVVVVGAGNSAGQAVMHLAGAGARVVMVVRGDRLGKSMSGYLVDRIAAEPRIELRLRTEVEAVDAEDGRLAGVRLRTHDGGGGRLAARALFLCLGGTPRTDWAADNDVRLDPAGFILTGPDLLVNGRRPEGWPLARDPLALETSVPGLFAAGDVRHGSAKRVAGAVGDGAMAVALVHRCLEERLASGA